MPTWKNPRKRFKTNRRLMVKVLRILAEFHDNLHPNQSRKKPPEVEQMPSEIIYGSREHALFVFMSGQVSVHGSKTWHVIKKIAEVFTNYRFLLDPEMDISDEENRNLLRKIIPFGKSKEEYLIGWKNNLVLLRDEYDNDPRKIFYGLKSRSRIKRRLELIDRLSRFARIGQKVAQLLMVWFQAVDWQDDHAKDWEKVRHTPAFAADIHAIRIAFQTGIMTEPKSDYQDSISLPLSNEYIEVCLNNKISYTSATQGCYEVGSQICAKTARMTPVNRAHYCMSHCPIWQYCKGRVPADPDNKSRGKIHFENFVPHPDKVPVNISLPL